MHRMTGVFALRICQFVGLLYLGASNAYLIKQEPNFPYSRFKFSVQDSSKSLKSIQGGVGYTPIVTLTKISVIFQIVMRCLGGLLYSDDVRQTKTQRLL